MRRIIKGVAYDTDTADFIASADHGEGAPSMGFWSLYRTSTGGWFQIAADHDGMVDTFTPLSDADAQAWLERYANNLVEQYFGPMPELRPVNGPMTIDKRRLILASTSLLKALGHAGFERVLLEFGVPDDVGGGSGLLARTTSLGRYVMSNPDAVTYDGSSLADAIIARAQEVHDSGTTHMLSERDRQEYANARAAFPDQPAASARGGRDLTATEARAIAEAAGPSADSLAAFFDEPPPERPKARRKVFIVHGHDAGPREAVARTLERLDFEPVILHERPNKGRTIITKFQQEAADVGFAVVLMTPDDPGASADLRRARQNVVFELGFFIGALGPERVAAIVKGNVERPSDFDGVMYIPFDDAGSWRHTLARELGAAGFEVDLNKLA